MNKLIWKELREMRLIPAAVASLVVVILFVYATMSNWMATHGFGSSERLTPTDCLPILILGLAGCGIFVGSLAIAPETGNGTIAFLTSLPISRPRLWTAKVIAGLLTMAVSAATVVMAYIITVYCLCHVQQSSQALSGINDPIIAYALTGTAANWMSASAFHAAIVALAIAACFYCISLLVSTLTDRTSTAAIVAVIASVAVGGGLIYFLNRLDESHSLTLPQLTTYEHDPHSLQAEVVACALVVLGLLSTSFAAFCQANQVRTRRRLGIAAVLLLGWFTTSGVAFAAYGRYWRANWKAIAVRRSAALVANQAEFDRMSSVVAAPLVRGQRWTILIDHVVIGGPGYVVPCYTTIDLGSDDLDTPGAMPVKADAGKEVQASVGPHPWLVNGVDISHQRRGIDIYRHLRNAAVQRGTLGRSATARQIGPGEYLATVKISYVALPPAGQDRQTVRLYDKRDRLLGAIDIVANKVMFVDHCKSVPGGSCW